MLSFHADPKIKAKYLKRVRAHIKADNLIRGEGWNGSKGCAVGCTLENYDHKKYETELGIPEWLARVEDGIFEGMTEKKSRTWPAEFLSAIKPGVNLEIAKTKFIIIVLESCLESMDSCKFDRKKNPDVVKAIEGSKVAILQMIKAHKDGDPSAARSAASAASAAWSAAWSAESAARSAESAASAASAARSAESAARSAAWSAESAARSAESAARSAESAARSARSAKYDYFADQLIKILKGIK